MVAISFTQFRQNAKVYFDAVEKGEIVRVLRHGKVIAEISSPSPKHLLPEKSATPLTISGFSFSKAIINERKRHSR